MLNSPWAYTGSIAMKMHANKKGAQSRNSKNVDIVVMDPKMTSSFLASSKKWMYVNGPPMSSKTNHVRMYRVNNGRNLDIFRFGGRLANGPNKIRLVDGVPIMSVRSLLNKKRVTLNNYPSNKKTMNNINTLNKLSPTPNKRHYQKSHQKKKRNLSPIKRSLFF